MSGTSDAVVEELVDGDVGVVVALDRHDRRCRGWRCLALDEAVLGHRAVGGDVARRWSAGRRRRRRSTSSRSRVQVARTRVPIRLPCGSASAITIVSPVPGRRASACAGSSVSQRGLRRWSRRRGAFADAGGVLLDERLDLLGDLERLRAAEGQRRASGERVGPRHRIAPVPRLNSTNATSTETVAPATTAPAATTRLVLRDEAADQPPAHGQKAASQHATNESNLDGTGRTRRRSSSPYTAATLFGSSRNCVLARTNPGET